MLYGPVIHRPGEFMKFIRTYKDNKIHSYYLPDVGDKVVDKDGNEGHCSGIFHCFPNIIYEISDGINSAGVKEDVFSSGVLSVVT